METIIIYILMFFIGIMFGSFFTLAVYRIPLHQDITHERSYCPKCNHKLGFWDLIPVFSYIFLRGRCRYCKEKIRPRYLILEICSGIVFVLFTISIKLSFYTFEQDKIAYLIFGILFIAGLIIIAGIDKEKKDIPFGLLLYELIIVSGYMIYLYILDPTNIYRYVIYLIVVAILLILNTIYLRKKLKNNYTLEILILSVTLAAFTGRMQFIITVIMTLLAISIDELLEKIKNRKINKKQEKIKQKELEQKTAEKLPIAFYMCTCNIIITIFINLIVCR